MAIDLNNLRQAVKSQYDQFLVSEAILIHFGKEALFSDQARLIIQNTRRINAYIEKGDAEGANMCLEAFLDGTRIDGDTKHKAIVDFFEERVSAQIARLRSFHGGAATVVDALRTKMAHTIKEDN